MRSHLQLLSLISLLNSRNFYSLSPTTTTLRSLISLLNSRNFYSLSPTTTTLRSLLVVVVSLLAVASTASAALGRRGNLVGGYQSIKDLHDPHVVEIAKYAVTEHNSQAKTALENADVVKDESQVVAGMNYWLVITAKNGGATVAKYEAFVYGKAWQHYRKLESFKAI